MIQAQGVVEGDDGFAEFAFQQVLIAQVKIFSGFVLGFVHRTRYDFLELVDGRAEIPCLFCNVTRGGPGLGTIQPSQSDYFQSTKGGGHGDYHTIVLAPNSVQESVEFVYLGFELADKYRTPVTLLSDGAIGQMMEKVELPDPIEYKPNKPWATTGKTKDRERNILTSLYIESEDMEEQNRKLQRKYEKIKQNEVRYEEYQTEDAEIIITSFGLSSRVCRKSVDIGRENGMKIGLFRHQTLWPFPWEKLKEYETYIKTGDLYCLFYERSISLIREGGILVFIILFLILTKSTNI